MSEEPQNPETSVTPEFIERSAKAAIKALRGLEQTAIMLETWAPEIFPNVNDLGQIHSGRAVMESAAESIRSAWADAIAEVSAKSDAPAPKPDGYLPPYIADKLPINAHGGRPDSDGVTTPREAAWRAGAEAMREAVENDMTARVQAERIMRGAARRDKDQERAIMHTDRALAFYEMALAVVAFPIPPCPPREGDGG